MRKSVSTALVDGVGPGDYVIVHVGHAIGLIDPVEAERTLALFAELDSEASGAGAGTNANANTSSSTDTDTRTFPAPVNDPRSRETDPRP